MSNSVNDHLLETRNRLVNEITFLSYDEFNHHPSSNKWSVAEV